MELYFLVSNQISPKTISGICNSNANLIQRWNCFCKSSKLIPSLSQVVMYYKSFEYNHQIYNFLKCKGMKMKHIISVSFENIKIFWNHHQSYSTILKIPNLGNDDTHFFRNMTVAITMQIQQSILNALCINLVISSTLELQYEPNYICQINMNDINLFFEQDLSKSIRWKGKVFHETVVLEKHIGIHF